MKQETRTFEMRAASKEFVITGRAVAYGKDSKPLPFIEQVAARAFADSLKTADVKALVNHDPSQLLGRMQNGTLELEDTDEGLNCRINLNPDVQAHQDLWALCSAGTISECSFAFSVPPDGDSWSETQRAGKSCMLRTIRKANLLDISVVTQPAYNDTTATARSLEDAAWLAKAKTRLAALNAQIDAEHRAAAEKLAKLS